MEKKFSRRPLNGRISLIRRSANPHAANRELLAVDWPIAGVRLRRNQLRRKVHTREIRLEIELLRLRAQKRDIYRKFGFSAILPFCGTRSHLGITKNRFVWEITPLAGSPN